MFKEKKKMTNKDQKEIARITEEILAREKEGSEIHIDIVREYLKQAQQKTRTEIIELIDEFFGSDRMWSTKIARLKRKIIGEKGGEK